MYTYIYSKQTSSTFLLGIWKNDNNSFSLTCVWRSGKQSLIFLNTSALSWEQIEPLVHESLEVPSLLCSHNDVSLSLTFAILNRGTLFFRQSAHKLKWRPLPNYLSGNFEIVTWNNYCYYFLEGLGSLDPFRDYTNCSNHFICLTVYVSIKIIGSFRHNRYQLLVQWWDCHLYVCKPALIYTTASKIVLVPLRIPPLPLPWGSKASQHLVILI